MTYFVIVSDADDFDPEIAAPAIKRLGLVPMNQVYVYDCGVIYIVPLETALGYQGSCQCPNFYMMFTYDGAGLPPQDDAMIYKETASALNRRCPMFREAKVKLFVAHIFHATKMRPAARTSAQR